MCGCRGARIKQQVAAMAREQIAEDLVSVTTSTAEPVFGCVTGTRYPFDERSSLYVDKRDAECFAEQEYQITWE